MRKRKGKVIILSKYLKQKRFYVDNELDFWLDECYFHSSRDKEYPSVVMNKFARCAMWVLWDTEEINLFGVLYNNQDIRRIMIEEMIPEDIDTAVSVFRNCKATVKLLSPFMFYLLFVIINRDEIINEWFKRTYPQAMEKGKFVPPPNCRRYWRNVG
ncbi:MAG TPA: hypothetical protein DIC46_00425 [Porphyromonadaceae bacterium]|jgi:hypothetical protein|nr:hypothetical protein [Porphyromonadaceae bacterium]